MLHSVSINNICKYFCDLLGSIVLSVYYFRGFVAFVIC